MKKIFKGVLFSALTLAHSLSAAWNPPLNVSAVGDSAVAGGPVLDVNALNNGIAVWGTPGVESLIQASFYTFGIGWEAPVTISDTSLNPFGNPTYTNQADPSVSINLSNYVVAVWEGTEFVIDNDFEGVFSATRAPDGTWSSVQQIRPLAIAPDLNPENPFVDVNNAGLAVAVWTEIRDSERYIMANFLPFGGVWGTPVELSNPPGGSRNEPPRVSIDPSGNAAAIWKADSSLGSEEEVGASTYNAGTGLWTTLILDPQGTFDLPHIGIDNNGNAVAVWNRTTGLFPNILDEVVSSTFNFVTQSWSPITIITSALDINGDSLDLSDVVVDQFGNATAVWSLQTLTTNSVYSSYLPLGGTWSAPELIVANAFTDQILAQIVISADLQGNVIAIVRSVDGNWLSVARVVGFGWQPPQFIGGSGLSIWPNIGLGTCGFALALWGEAFTTIGTENISAILPVPPFDLIGSRCCQKFATQTICLCSLNWEPSPLCTTFYRVYRDGVLIATVPGTETSYVDPCRRGSHVYSVTSVNIFGTESAPISITLR